MSINYEKRVVAFIDILGFRNIIKESEFDINKLEKIYNALEYLKNWEKPTGWSLKTIEIEEDAQKKGVQLFEISERTTCTCFSDSIVVSISVDENNINEVVSTLIANLSFIGAYLITENIIIRGGITFGNLIHNNNGIILGQALIDAYNTETDIAIYPRIVLSSKLLRKLNYPLQLKSDRYPYHQYLKRFKDGCVGFHQMVFFQVIQSWVEIDKIELATRLKRVKNTIINGLDNSFDSPSIFSKYKWLKDEYSELIILEENVKEDIHELNDGISDKNIHFSTTDGYYYPQKG